MSAVDEVLKKSKEVPPHKNTRDLVEGIAAGFVAQFGENKALYDAFNKRISERQACGPLLAALYGMNPAVDFVLTECPFYGINDNSRRVDYVIGYRKTLYLVELKVLGAARASVDAARLKSAWDKKSSGVVSQLKNLETNDKKLKEIARLSGYKKIYLLPLLIIQYSRSSKDGERLEKFDQEDRQEIYNHHHGAVMNRKISAAYSTVRFLEAASGVSPTRSGRFRSTRAFGFYAGSSVLVPEFSY